ncbi:MAG: hypothetical protein WBE80_15760, partial [Methylocella sp.]
PIRVADNPRRRKSSSSKRLPRPAPVPETPPQLIEIPGMLNESPGRCEKSLEKDAMGRHPRLMV